MTPGVENQPAKAPQGLSRLGRALRYSFAGFRHALRNEAALREEIVLFVLLAPASLFFPVSRVEHLLLVASMLIVILVEFLNSAIEAAIDRISTERHALSGQAKDMGSAAVLVSLVLWALVWGVILVPVLRSWLSRSPA